MTADPSTSLDIGSILMGVLGGLALFLYGMHKMSEGLRAAAGDRMKLLLEKLTTNRFTAALTGAVVTAVMQSSSITTVLVVGFVSAGLMSLTQTVGIIMGANVGTTVTAQILAFNITDYAWLMVACGFAAWSFSRRDVMRNVGALFMGLGMLFVGMGQMGDATGPLRTHQPFIDLMARMDNRFLAVLVGATFTALVQSSSATIGIVIMLASQGHISLEAGISLGIGAKIGTCVTAVLAGLGKPAEAQRVGAVHVLFNVLGALMWLPFIDHLALLASAVSPTAPHLQGVERLAEETPRQVANAITIYACVNLLIMIWFAKPLALLAGKLIPDRTEPSSRTIQAKYLDAVYVKTPALALDRLRLEITRLGHYVMRMAEAAPPAVQSGSNEELDALAKMDNDVDELHAAILKYTALLGREELQTAQSHTLEIYLKLANNLEAIGDLIETILVAQGRQRVAYGFTSSETLHETARPFFELILQNFTDVLTALRTNDVPLAHEVISRKDLVRELYDACKDQIATELMNGNGKAAIQFRVEADTIDQILRIGYHVRRIAKAIAS